MPTQQKYTPLFLKARDWPVVQLHRQRKTFLRDVIRQSVQVLQEQYQGEALHTLLSKTLTMEQDRLAKKPWKADPADEGAFWERMAADLAGQHKVPPPVVLENMVQHYAEEIAGKFSVTHYRLIEYATTRLFTRLLNPMKLTGLRTLKQAKLALQDQIQIFGAIDQLRALAKIGTVVIVPTHFSHLDSLLMGLVLNVLGLPPVIYGAGLNLFGSKFFAHFMGRLGTYTIDRRKKNLPYLTTLKTYSSLALQRGCHSLFYIGGTRSRSGALEREAKLGLLGTAFDAQKAAYQAEGPTARKIFVVPVVSSYHCVLEAPILIKSHPDVAGKPIQRALRQEASRIHKLLQFSNKLFTKSSSITVSIGQPMDLLGNVVDHAGNSYDAQGEYIDLYQKLGPDGTAQQSTDEYTQQLGRAIIRAYYRHNYVLTSHLVAFAAFGLLYQQHPQLSQKALLELPPQALSIAYDALKQAFGQLRDRLITLQATQELQIENKLEEGDIDGMIRHGLDNLGLYHHKRPLLQTKTGDIVVQDVGTLFYYRNRLTGYGLEAYFA